MFRFSDLTQDEKEKMIRYPAYLSLLASTAEKNLDRLEMKTAVRIAHVRTFAGDGLVADYYRELDKRFIDILTSVLLGLPKDKLQRDAVIAIELQRLDEMIGKFSPDYAEAFRHSLRMYKNQILKAHQNALEYFVIPVGL